MLKIEIPVNNIVRVYGPAALTVLKGSIDVLGKRYGVGDKLIVHKIRSYPVIAVEETVVEASLGVEARIEEACVDSEPVVKWIESVEKILEKSPSRVVVIGPVDSGKSSYSLLLANKALDKGYQVAIIDSDVGQADIGPPCFISLSLYREKAIWMRELEPNVMRFIGDIRPQYRVDKIVYEVRELIDYAFNKFEVNFVVIDTDGWVGDMYAIDYKARLIEAVKPDAVAVLGRDLHGVFKCFEKTGVSVYELEAPLQVRGRSRDVRRRLRSEQYRRFLEEAPVRRYSVDEIVLTNMPLFYGVEIDVGKVSSIIGGDVVYASRVADTLFIVTTQHPRNIQSDKLKNAFNVSRIRVYNPGFEKRLYVAVSDGLHDYPCLVESIDFKDRSIALRTKYSDKPLLVKFSKIRLTEDYLEQIIEYT